MAFFFTSPFSSNPDEPRADDTPFLPPTTSRPLHHFGSLHPHNHNHRTSSLLQENDDRYGDFNFTNASYPNDTTSPELEDNFNRILKHFVTPALFYSITLVGVAGNSLVIYVILSNQKMRTVINLLLLNLALADLSFVAVVPPSTSYYLAMEHWPFGGPACKTMHYLVNVTAYVTVYTLVLISVIRFLTVVRGLNTTAWKTRRMVVIAAVGMWLLMLLLNIPILFNYKVLIDPDGAMACDYEDQVAGRAIFTTFFVFAYVLPLVCIGILSVGILNHIEKNKPTCGPMLASHRKTRSGIKKRQASRLLILVVVIFAVSWLPIQLHLLLGSHFSVPESNLYAILNRLFCLLAYSNSCVNPIIYNHTSRDFREAFRMAVGRCCVCCTPFRKQCTKEATTFSVADTAAAVSAAKKRDIQMEKIDRDDEPGRLVVEGGAGELLSGDGALGGLGQDGGENCKKAGLQIDILCGTTNPSAEKGPGKTALSENKKKNANSSDGRSGGGGSIGNEGRRCSNVKLEVIVRRERNDEAENAAADCVDDICPVTQL